MEQIWQSVCTHFAIPEEVSKTWFNRIKQQLSNTDPNRAYHNWQEMILHKESHLVRCNPCIILAALFQYYHFDGNQNCVQENCDIFEEFCRDAMIEDENSKSLILQLLGKQKSDGELKSCCDNEANLLQDIDLIILAAPAEEYKNYTQLLRREYAQLNDENYRYMRLKVLETLLIIPNIYSTPHYQDKYEEAARANIKNEIIELKQ